MKTPDRYWIVDAVGHRQAQTAAYEEMISNMSDESRAGVIMTPVPDNVWMCDMCNAEMEVVDQYGLPTLVWMEGSYALCGKCAKPHLEEHGYPRAACRCAGCRKYQP